MSLSRALTATSPVIEQKENFTKGLDTTKITKSRSQRRGGVRTWQADVLSSSKGGTKGGAKFTRKY
jgi:hypothetical protein